MSDLSVLDRLQSQLLTSGIQQKNQPLFQVISQLIKFVRENFQSTNATVTSISGGGGGSTSSTTLLLGTSFPYPISPLTEDELYPLQPIGDSIIGTTTGPFTQIIP